MLYFLILLSLLLPLTTLAIPAPLRDHSWNSTNSTFSILADDKTNLPDDENRRPGWLGGNRGDTLGITRCYCASKNWETDDMFGYYYLFDYYNVHTDNRFLLERICRQSGRTRTGIYGSVNYQIKCLRPRFGEEECMKDVAGNKFCYHFEGKEKFDYFTYNGQKRGVPLDSKVAVHYSEKQVEKKCEDLCFLRCGVPGGMEMLKGLSLHYAEQNTPGQDRFHSGTPELGTTSDNEWSRIAYYPEVDDMCHGCRR